MYLYIMESTNGPKTSAEDTRNFVPMATGQAWNWRKKHHGNQGCQTNLGCALDQSQLKYRNTRVALSVLSRSYKYPRHTNSRQAVSCCMQLKNPKRDKYWRFNSKVNKVSSTCNTKTSAPCIHAAHVYVWEKHTACCHLATEPSPPKKKGVFRSVWDWLNGL